MSSLAQRRAQRTSRGTDRKPYAQGRNSRDTRSSSSSGSSTQVIVTGWESSKASSNSDRGVSDLIAFLERKATTANEKSNSARGSSSKGISKRSNIRIRKYKIEGNKLIITATTDEARILAGLNDYTFAGVHLRVTSLASAGARGKDGSTPFSFRKNTEEVKNKLKGVLQRRYDTGLKLLNLSNLAIEPEMQELGVKDMSSHPNLWNGLMAICDETFRSAKEKIEAVTSISIANNGLTRVAPVREVANTFPALKNLDLSNNQLSTMQDLQAFRHKFKQLEHIVIGGNPIIERVPQLKKELLRMYPALSIIDNVPLTPAEMEAARTKKVPLPVKPGFIVNTGNIGEDFVRNFFTGYDTDRNTLVNFYYDDQSTFSLSVNTHALRDPGTAKTMQKQEWDAYIRLSRNLNKITHLNARHQRLHRGRTAILKLLETLPQTQHPNLEADPSKWLVEILNQPGVPDATGTHPGGVNGLCIIIHGEFEESAGFSSAKKQRSFDRTFVLGPGTGQSPVRIISDALVLRAYGGTQAFQPDDVAMSPEEEKAAMIAEVMRQTGMNKEYAIMCLAQNGGSVEAAISNFAEVRANIPPEAFVQQ